MAGGSVDREIKISASDTGVFSKLTKIKEGALAMGRGIAEDAKKQATSSRELIKLMNDEIALIEKRNKLNKETREISAKEKYGDDDDGLKEQVKKISVESKEDKVQTDILKQILQGILKTSQEEVTTDRELAKESIQSDKSIEAMDDHEEALGQIIKKRLVEDDEEIEGDGEEDTKRRRKSNIAGMGGFIKETDAYSMGFEGSSNFMKSRASGVENKLGKRALLAGGMIMGGLGMTISAASDRFEGQGDLFRATGTSAGYGDVKDMTVAQTSTRASQVNLAYGDRMDNDEMRRVLSYERSHGIDGQKLASMSRFGGGEEGGKINESGIMFGFMKDVMKDRDMNQAKTNDLLEASLTLQEQEFMATGKGSGMLNTAIINRLMSGQEVASAKRASATAGRLGGMIEGGNEQLEAIKFSEFQKKEGGGYLEYLKEKEKGVSGSIDDVVVDRILSSKMGKDDKMLSLISTGLTYTDSEEIIKAGGVSPLATESTGVDEEGEGKMSWEGIERERDEAMAGGVNKITESASWVTDGFASVGEAAVDLVDTLVGSAQELGSWFSSEGKDEQMGKGKKNKVVK